MSSWWSLASQEKWLSPSPELYQASGDKERGEGREGAACIQLAQCCSRVCARVVNFS